jgi:hypothetical protein
MTLSRVVMRLARNPGEFAGGDDHRGYALILPQTAEDHIDLAAYAKQKEACQVRRFAPDEEPVTGRLVRRGQQWFIDYGDVEATDEEPLFRLGDHRFAVGEYVTVTDEDAGALTYKVSEVTPV